MSLALRSLRPKGAKILKVMLNVGPGYEQLGDPPDFQLTYTDPFGAEKIAVLEDEEFSSAFAGMFAGGTWSGKMYEGFIPEILKDKEMRVEMAVFWSTL